MVLPTRYLGMFGRLSRPAQPKLNLRSMDGLDPSDTKTSLGTRVLTENVMSLSSLFTLGHHLGHHLGQPGLSWANSDVRT